VLTGYYWGDKIEKNEMGGACSAYGEKRDVYRILVGNREGNNIMLYNELQHIHFII